MTEYDQIRTTYKPSSIKLLFIAESPPPEAKKGSSRHFYRTDLIRRDDRLFTNTVKAFYPETAKQTEAEIQAAKDKWLRRLQADGVYMIEALDQSQPHEVTKDQRQQLIQANLPNLIKKVQSLAGRHTKIILIKSNVFEMAAEPLRQAGFTVLNKELVDYPGRFNQKSYRQKLSELAQAAGF